MGGYRRAWTGMRKGEISFFFPFLQKVLESFNGGNVMKYYFSRILLESEAGVGFESYLHSHLQ